ncbi:RICIN domain-containing protein [Streptomyces sp. NPDC052701]|uniref:RICIN domain-containing protein n=1 Tax=Streptomyces sp. NPDC052701 TaxID=3155533 RepID=UPI00341FEB36
MPTPHPPRPPYPPPGKDPGESDESLAARLRGRPQSEAAAHSVALLMARHWQPVHDYAVVCLASSARAAALVTATAFHRTLNLLAFGESALALRPALLVTVRETVREWAADNRISAVLPELEKPAGGRGMRTAAATAPENRALAERSFRALPAVARCLLWHVEVEAEPLAVPAGLLGMDIATASTALEQAREKFREGCARAHHVLAPTEDCRLHTRLPEVPVRRGGALPPDVREHLDRCPHCRQAAGLLGRTEDALGELIAEAVLGWGARRYLDSRPGRAARSARTGRAARRAGRHGARPPGGGSGLPPRTHGPGGRIAGARLPRALRSSRALLSGFGAVSAGVLATVLVVSASSQGGQGTDPAGSTGAAAGGATPPGASATAPGDAALPTAPGRTRLRDAAGLCLDVRGAPEEGAGTRLAVCSAAPTQRWTYEEDGLLRSVAEPGLCLDSRKDAGVVVLGGCADEDDERGEDVRYDLTVRGELLPRWDERLALAPTAGAPDADIVVKVRDRSDAQRWRTDPVATAGGSRSVAGAGGPAGPPVERAARPG